MANFDIESYRDYMLGLLQAGMSAKITELNTEKGDSLLTSLASNQYLNSFNNVVNNFEQFLYYKITEIKTLESHAGGVSRQISMMFVMCFTADDWVVAEKKILRYTRAIEEIFLAGAKAESRISDFELDVFEPDIVQLSENSPWLQAGGVMVRGVVVT